MEQQQEAAAVAEGDVGSGSSSSRWSRRWRWWFQKEVKPAAVAVESAGLQRSVIIRTQTQTQSTHVLEWAVGSDWSGPGPRRAPDPHRFHSLAGHLITDNKPKAKRSWN